MKHMKGRFLSHLRVKDLLTKSVGGREDARPLRELHASDLTKQDPEFCPRAVALMRLLGVKKSAEYIPQALRVTFDSGKDTQWRLNNQYLREWMVGGWSCSRCPEEVLWGRYPGLTEHPTKCASPYGHEWNYVEPEFRHPSGFTGSIDGVVQFSPAKLRMVEFKIVKGEPSAGSAAPNFKEIIAPLAEHRVRTQLYLRLIAESPDKRTAQLDVSEAHVLYISRGHGAKDDEGKISPFKEFIVKRDDPRVERYVRMANAVKGDMPEGICPSAMCKRALKCSVVKDCFSGRYPAVNKWSKGL